MGASGTSATGGRAELTGSSRVARNAPERHLPPARTLAVLVRNSAALSVGIHRPCWVEHEGWTVDTQVWRTRPTHPAATGSGPARRQPSGWASCSGALCGRSRLLSPPPSGFERTAVVSVMGRRLIVLLLPSQTSSVDSSCSDCWWSPSLSSLRPAERCSWFTDFVAASRPRSRSKESRARTRSVVRLSDSSKSWSVRRWRYRRCGCSRRSCSRCRHLCRDDHKLPPTAGSVSLRRPGKRCLTRH